MGVKIVMLTGDNWINASVIAQEAGVDVSGLGAVAVSIYLFFVMFVPEKF
jgi:high-affinity K+ transport system ATPase subunit B